MLRLRPTGIRRHNETGAGRKCNELRAIVRSELAHRPVDMRLRRRGADHELVLQPDERALDVFHHPYAYAAARGLDSRPERPQYEEAFVMPDRYGGIICLA